MEREIFAERSVFFQILAPNFWAKNLEKENFSIN